MTINHYHKKRVYLKKYIHLKRKVSKIRKDNRNYEVLTKKLNNYKRQFYQSKIDDIIENWNNYEYCPGRKCHRALTGLIKTLNEIQH